MISNIKMEREDFLTETARKTSVCGYVEHIDYRNEENGYTVLHLAADGDEITCVGSLPFLSEGELIEASGFYTVHASYGEQFQIESYQVKMPDDEVAIERYLGSGAIKGVGSALAARIVRRFGKDSLRIIEQEPEQLAAIKGISERKAREIAAQVEEKKDMREAMMFLAEYGISTALAVRIFNIYGNEIYRVIQENPYRMADDVSGVGFRTADEIARRAGIRADSDFRIRSGMLYVLGQAEGEGHIYLPKEVLIGRAVQLLGVTADGMEDQLMNLVMDHRVVVKRLPAREGRLRSPSAGPPDFALEAEWWTDDQTDRPESMDRQGSTDPMNLTDPGDSQAEMIDAVYLAAMYHMERNTARMLHDLNISASIDEEAVLEQIRRIEKRTKVTLAEHQREAVLETVRSGLVVLTGGPGTGKTTTINTMISFFEEEGLKIALAAPTGRAAKRMTEATGHEAKTIHRLLEVSGGPDGGNAAFGKDASDPLEADVIIVDEMSMVDAFLMYALLNAVTVGTRLVMVGDVNQLPSVGPGCILKDIIEAGFCKVVCLTQIFRQSRESDIVMNAHRIHVGEHPVLDNKSRDFFFLKRQDANMIISNTIQLVSQKLPGYVHAAANEIQVLTPTRKGLLGVERLNRILQQYLNPPAGNKREYTKGEILFREGDKVMQIKNNYQIVWEVRGRYGYVAESGTGVFNGDMGVIREINESLQQITVEFDDHRYVDYPFGELEELEHAYAVTIHKSQGSEYPAVVIPLLPGPRMLMNRNLIYTAITRAKSCVTIVGDPEVFGQMIDNTRQQRRYTSLRYWICNPGIG